MSNRNIIFGQINSMVFLCFGKLFYYKLDPFYSIVPINPSTRGSKYTKLSPHYFTIIFCIRRNTFPYNPSTYPFWHNSVVFDNYITFPYFVLSFPASVGVCNLQHYSPYSCAQFSTDIKKYRGLSINNTNKFYTINKSPF